MKSRPNSDGEVFADLHFPAAGVDVQASWDRQPNRPSGDGQYARTTPKGVNVRAYEPLTDRKRGGQRSGLVKYAQGQVNGSAAIQEITSVVVTIGTVPGSGSTASPFIGTIGHFNAGGGLTTLRMGSYDPISGLLYDSATLTFTSTSPRYSRAISARSFASGGANPSYTAIGIADGTGVTTTFGVWEPGESTFTASSTPYYEIVVNGKRLTYTTTLLPFAFDALTCAVASSSYHIVVGLLRSTEGRLAAVAYDDEGNVVWSNASVVATGEIFEFPFAYRYRLGVAVSGSYILTLSGKAGLIRCALSNGSSGSIITTAAAINALASGYYLQTGGGRNRPDIGQNFAIAGGVAAIPIVGNVTTSGSLYYAAGLAFITVADGSEAFTAVTGLQTDPPIYNDGGTTSEVGCFCKVATDGTNFYVFISTTRTGKASIVKKLDGTDGSVLWTATTTHYASGENISIFYAGGTVQVSGPGYSVALNPTTGAVAGEGFIGGAHVVYGFAPAGSVTVGATTLSSGAESGPYDALIAVAGGTVKVRADGSWQSVTNGAALSTTAKVVRSAPNGGRVFFADGTSQTYWDPADNTMKPWLPTAGSLPVDGAGNKPRLITTWRGRTVLSGLPRDPRNWFMSAVNDPFDWDYGPVNVTPTQAIAGNNAPAGFVGDVITGFLPYTDDVLFIGGDHTLWVMQGDPMAGGQIDLVTSAIGVAWGNAFAMDPGGAIYFFSNQWGVFRLIPGQKPVRLSQAIEKKLKGVNLSNAIVRLQWNDRSQGLHVFVTPHAGDATTHYFWEARTNAWWEDVFANPDHSPRCCYTFEDTAIPGQSTLIGSSDGYIRSFSDEAGTDDGATIASEVWIGPLLTKDFDELMLHHLQAILGETSGTVTWAVHVGDTAEQAFLSEAVETGDWIAGRNVLDLVKRSGYAVLLRITGLNPWALESVRAKYTLLGKIRRRGN